MRPLSRPATEYTTEGCQGARPICLLSEANHRYTRWNEALYCLGRYDCQDKGICSELEADDISKETEGLYRYVSTRRVSISRVLFRYEEAALERPHGYTAAALDHALTRK
jgi:hypothetical protein